MKKDSPDRIIKKTRARAPRIKIGFYPTPIQRLDKMSKSYGVNFYMKST